MLSQDGIRAENKDGVQGLRIGRHFIPVGSPRACDGVICKPVAWGRSIPGSSKGTCSRCGQPVWISPSTQEVLEQNPMPLICAMCIPSDKEKK